MTTYRAPVKDYKFLIHDFLRLGTKDDLPCYEEASSDIINAVLEEGAKLTEEVFHPLNQSGDEEGCTLKEGTVTTPKGFKEAYQQYVDGGWQGMTSDPEYGGQGLPEALGLAFNEMQVSANWGLAMYPGLTKGATEAIHAWANDELKSRYLPKMLTGQWSGTMNLTEPQCGTDLGLLTTRADKSSDGTYKITGTKIFISAGDHDLTENVIHLVLARIAGAPEGMKGISLFIVPRNTVAEDGATGGNNGVSVGSLEEKMGIHSNSTCVMNFDDAQGYLIGSENKGMRAMFTMMNEARLGVAFQGLAIAEVAQQNAVIYANERLQGRSLTGEKFPDQKADPIMVHPDVRRMLMTNRAFIEGARAFGLWSGELADISRQHKDEGKRKEAVDMLALVIPVLKSYLTDQGVESASRALQVYGGHGYIKETGAEQFLRDSRIAPIYEGTNGIQAMDLVGRKLGQNNGETIRALFLMLTDFIETHKDNEKASKHIALLEKALGRQQAATMWLMQNGMSNPDNAGASAHYYLNLMALMMMGYFWVGMEIRANEMLETGEGDASFLKNKIITSAFFFEHIMPETASLRYKVEAGAKNVMALAAEDF